MWQESRMPQSQENSWGQIDFPVRLRRDDFVHQLEQSLRVILGLYVDIEFDVQILRLRVEERYFISLQIHDDWIHRPS